MTKALNPVQVPFWTPISYNCDRDEYSPEIDTSIWLTAFVDSFFHLCGPQAILTERPEDEREILITESPDGTTRTVQISLGAIESSDLSPSCIATVLKIVAYMTIIIPVVMLLAKLILRLCANYHLIERLPEKPPAEVKQTKQTVQSQPAAQPPYNLLLPSENIGQVAPPLEQAHIELAPPPEPKPSVTLMPAAAALDQRALGTAKSEPEKQEAPTAGSASSSKPASTESRDDSKSADVGAGAGVLETKKSESSDFETLLQSWATKYGFNPDKKFQNTSLKDSSDDLWQFGEYGRLYGMPYSLLSDHEKLKKHFIEGDRAKLISLRAGFKWMYNKICTTLPLLKQDKRSDFSFSARDLKGENEARLRYGPLSNPPTETPAAYEVLSQTDCIAVRTMMCARLNWQDYKNSADVRHPSSGEKCSMTWFILRVLCAEGVIADFEINPFNYYITIVAKSGEASE